MIWRIWIASALLWNYVVGGDQLFFCPATVEAWLGTSVLVPFESQFL